MTSSVTINVLKKYFIAYSSVLADFLFVATFVIKIKKKCPKSDKHFKLVSLKSIVSILFMQFEPSLTLTTPTLFLMALQPTMCYYNSGQLLVSLQITTTFITIDASLVITFLDNYYCNLQQILQFTTIITIYDRYYNSRQNTRGFTHCFPWIRRRCSVSDQSQFSQSYDSSCFRHLSTSILVRV